MLVEFIKHNVLNILRKNGYSDKLLYQMLQYINNILFHRNEKMIRKSYGFSYPNAFFYVIRRFSKEEGLLSMYFSILKDIAYAQAKGYIPFVDLQNNKTQYTTGELLNGTRNAWEYFWEQPSNYDIGEIYQSKNVILSGRSRWADQEKKSLGLNSLLNKYNFYDAANTHALYQFIKKNADIKPFIYEKAERIQAECFGEEKVIGVFVRGTDYTVFQPKGHSVQPAKEYVYKRLMEMRGKYPDTKVFVVTEDDSIYQFFKDRCQMAMIEIEDIRFSEYKGDDYIFQYCKGNTYQIGLQYLIKLLLLANCQYLVASITNGSMFANIMNDNHYEERIIMDLGVYE